MNPKKKSRREILEEEEKERLMVSKVFENINLLMSTTHKSMGLGDSTPMLS